MRCANHPNLEAIHLCLGCGRWFCPACMASLQPQPVCIGCQARQAAGQPLLQVYQFSSAGQHAGVGPAVQQPIRLERWKPMLRLSLIVSNLVLAALAVYALTRLGSWLLFLPFGLSLLSHLALNRLAGASTKGGGRSQRPARGGITQAQVDALLRISGGKITARRLAAATGHSREAAERHLNQLVLDSKLQIGHEAEELVYTRLDSLE